MAFLLIFRRTLPSSRSSVIHRKMASSSLPTLPHVPGTDPSKCVFDSFRTSIAQRVSEALPPLTLEQAYSGVDYGKKGVDFTVALPRFRLPGKIDELASKVVSKVSRSSFTIAFLIVPRSLLPYACQFQSSDTYAFHSLKQMNTYHQSHMTKPSCIFNLIHLHSSDLSYPTSTLRTTAQMTQGKAKRSS